MHLNKAAQKVRLEKLEKDPLTRWRVTREQWRNWKRYDRFVDAAEEMIRRTSLATPRGPSSKAPTIDTEA